MDEVLKTLDRELAYLRKCNHQLEVALKESDESHRALVRQTHEAKERYRDLSKYDTNTHGHVTAREHLDAWAQTHTY